MNVSTFDGATIICAACGTPTPFDLKSRSGKVIADCSSCGTRVTVKGGAVSKASGANVHVDPPVEPGAPKERAEDSEDNAPDGEVFVTLRFRITAEQRRVVRQAMAVARAQIGKIGGRMWHGVALEYICADFIAGAPQDAIEIGMADADTDPSLVL